jgi:DNA-binding CsgD family transcriptional regulator
MEHAAPPRPDDPVALLGAVVEALAADIDLSGACWHVTDPVTGIPLRGGRVGDPPGSFEQSLEYEYRRPDVLRFAELAASPRRCGVLSAATGGRRDGSARYAEMIAPGGAADELRASFTDAFGTWGVLALFSTRRFSSADAALVARAVPRVTAALRAASAPAGGAAADRAVAVIVLDAADRLRSCDEVGRRRIGELGGDEGALPSAFAVLAARARARDPELPAATDLCTGAGHWLALDAACLDDAPSGPVAIVIRPAARESVLDVVLRRLGLSAREREVARLTVGGHPAKAVAGALHLSPWTVQDHLKRVYDKTGVRTRGDLSALVASSAARA